MEQNWPVARKNSVRHHGREPRETKQECAKTCCECDSDHWQQWQLYGCHIGLMRRAFTDPKKAPQYDSQHSQKSHDSPLTVDQRQSTFT
jgi:hypothetical protein